MKREIDGMSLNCIWSAVRVITVHSYGNITP
jgi:hypothetical protein